jgi:hypothetical protein
MSNLKDPRQYFALAPLQSLLVFAREYAFFLGKEPNEALDRFVEPEPVEPVLNALHELDYFGVESDTFVDVADWFVSTQTDVENAVVNANKMVKFLDDYCAEKSYLLWMICFSLLKQSQMSWFFCGTL